MWIVAYALRRPFTVAAMALLILLVGTSALRKTPTDILPVVDIPALTIIWTYPGLSAEEMAARVASFSEISVLNTVDDLQRIESQTGNGVAVIRVQFQPGANIEMALSQISAVSQTMMRRMPPGITAPIIVRYSAGSVPILQLALSSQTQSEAQLYDYARLQLRAQIQTIPGVRMTLPYGGQVRQVMVDLDLDRLRALGLSPKAVADAVTAQNLALPSGSLREGGDDVPVSLNSSPATAEAFNDLPLREVNGKLVFLRDVATVRDGGAVQTNIARADGEAGVIVQLLKLGGASTIDVVDQLRERLPNIRAAAPEGVRVQPIFDQSLFVRSAISNVVKEALLVSLLVAAVVLLFLGSLRSTAIVLISIPLALLLAVGALYALGHSFNLMTLGGLSLAIGILVDNALVEIENTNRNVAEGLPLYEAILQGARQVVFPEFISTLSICIVFLPIFTLSGAPAFVFGPLALAVIFSMIASFILSRTLVPTLAWLMLPREIANRAAVKESGAAPGRLARVHHRFEHFLDDLRDRYRTRLSRLLGRRKLVFGIAAGVLLTGIVAVLNLGQTFFPTVDAGTMRIHVRAPAGMRIEETAALLAAMQREIRSIVPAEDLAVIVENIGVPDPINLGMVDSLAATPAEAEMLVQLAPGHRPTAGYQSKIRERLRSRFPEAQTVFRASDIVGQTLNAGAAAAIDIQVLGRDAKTNLQLARKIEKQVAAIPGASDVLLRQVPNWPVYRVEVDQARAASLGITQRAIADALVVSLSSSATLQPSFWREGGTSYAVAVQTPPDRLRSIEDVLNTPVATSGGGTVLLRAVATAGRKTSPANITRVMMQPTFDVLINVDEEATDLGTAMGSVRKIVAAAQAEVGPGNRVMVVGQGMLMQRAYMELGIGLLTASLLVYLVLLVNFQSWTLPLVALSALPFAVSGTFLGLLLTGTQISVPALTGIIMVAGVSTANSVLVASFARDLWLQGVAAPTAALEAAATRLRPVLMTATAMIIGMLPMAFGLGEGGEQNAPLGRAAIGGLLFGTIGTLLLVPVAFANFARRPGSRTPRTAAPQPPVALPAR